MDTCGGCTKTLRSSRNLPTVKCLVCELHFHFQCVNIPSTSKAPRDWKCPNCKVSTQKRGDNSNTPVRSLKETQYTEDPLKLTPSSTDKEIAREASGNLADVLSTIRSEINSNISTAISSAIKPLMENFLRLYHRATKVS